MSKKWIWIKFTRSVGHLVEERYVQDVLTDLLARDCGELDEFKVSEGRFFLDPGGMMLANEPSEELPSIDGLQVGVLSRSPLGFADRAERLEPREGGYVKLHSMYSCVCMAPDQRDRLVAELRRIGPAAEQRSADHFEEWKRARPVAR